MSIDGLRGLAILAVVATHAFHHGSFARIEAAWFQWLYAGITVSTVYPLLFVVSGFCIHLPWARARAANGEAQFAVRAFLGRRLQRTYPPYFLALCLSAGAVLVALGLGLQIETVSRYPEPALRWVGADFVLHAAMLHGIGTFWDVGLGNPPLWTLARLEYLYLLYVVALGWRRRLGLMPTMGLVGLVSVAIPLASWMVLRASPLSDVWQDRLLHLVQFETSAVALWFQWCLGMLAVEAHYGLVRLPAWSRRGWLAVVWCGAAIVADAWGWQLASPALWGLACFTFVSLVVTSERPGGLWTSSPLAGLVRLGTIGYSVYLIHSPVIGALNQAGRLLVGESSLAVQPAFHLAVWALLVLACCGAGWIYFQIAERWFFLNPAARQARG